MPIAFIAGSDPTAANTPANPNTVSVQTSTSANPITVPAYSVVRVDLNSPAVATAVSSASYASGPVAAQEIVAFFGPGMARGSAPQHCHFPRRWAAFRFRSRTARATLNSPRSSRSLRDRRIFWFRRASRRVAATVFGAARLRLGGADRVDDNRFFRAGAVQHELGWRGRSGGRCFLITASDQIVNQTVFTCNPPAVRSCLPAPLSLGGAGDTLYVELYGTGIRGAAAVQCFVAGQSVPVLYAGPVASDAGLDQVNISIPKSLAGAGDVRVYLVADGVASNVVGLNVQ